MFLPCCWEMLFSPAVGPLFCHSSRRSGSTPITVFWISSFFALSSTILFHRPIVWLLVIFSGIIQSGPVCPNCWLQLELCSLHGVSCASARSSTCFSVLSRAARGWSSSTTHSRARLLWVVTPFRATTTLLVSSLVHLT